MQRSISRRGFTLIEILIVVIILGILAAIVIPQFSSASNDARKSALASTAQTVRGEIALYQVQHNGVLPGAGASGFDSTVFWTQLTTKTDQNGVAYSAASSTTGPFGPYMQSMPFNPLSGAQAWQSTVADGSGGALSSPAGFVYDYTGTSGNFWGTDSTGKAIIP